MRFSAMKVSILRSWSTSSAWWNVYNYDFNYHQPAEELPTHRSNEVHPGWSHRHLKGRCPNLLPCQYVRSWLIAPPSPSHPPGTSGVICDCFFTFTFNRPLNQLTLLILSFMHPSSSSLPLNVILTLGTHYFLPELANWFLCLWYHSLLPWNSPPQPHPLFHLTHQSHQNYLYFSRPSHLHIFMWFPSLWSSCPSTQNTLPSPYYLLDSTYPLKLR